MTPQELKAIPGVPEEIDFWKGFVKTGQFAQWLASGPTPELLPEVVSFFQARPHARVLDVGSGAVSVLNGLVSDDRLVASDLLSPLYQEIFDYAAHGLRPPEPFCAEGLPYKAEFDVVHMRNALDHCQNPADAFAALVNATKPGGYVIVSGFENEADYMKGLGMHAWNLVLDGQRLVLSRLGKPFEQQTLGPCEGALLLHHMSQRVRLSSGRAWLLWIGWVQRLIC